jgi:hypothetical protein
MKRFRGWLLRLVRHRARAGAVGLALVGPAAWVEFFARIGEQWAWLANGIALVAGATGLALLWTALVGVAPDWTE